MYSAGQVHSQSLQNFIPNLRRSESKGELDKSISNSPGKKGTARQSRAQGGSVYMATMSSVQETGSPTLPQVGDSPFLENALEKIKLQNLQSMTGMSAARQSISPAYVDSAQNTPARRKLAPAGGSAAGSSKKKNRTPAGSHGGAI